MSNVPSNLKYTKDHEWVKDENGLVTMGITDFAQGSLGDLVYVELPKIGRQLKKGETFIIVESCKAASDVYAPISGEVVEVNDTVVGEPAIINNSPYQNGWLVKIKPANANEIGELLDPAKYTELAA